MVMPSASSRLKLSEPELSVEVESLVHPATTNAATRQQATLRFEISERIMNDCSYAPPPRSPSEVERALESWGEGERITASKFCSSPFEAYFDATCSASRGLGSRLWDELQSALSVQDEKVLTTRRRPSLEVGRVR
jgi:hypothetical protein